MPPHPSSERSTQNQIRYYWKHNLHGSCWPDKFGQSLYFQHWQETPGVCFGNDDVCGWAYVCRLISACIFRGKKIFSTILESVDIVPMPHLSKLVEWQLMIYDSSDTDWGRSSWWPRLLSLWIHYHSTEVHTSNSLFYWVCTSLMLLHVHLHQLCMENDPL